MLGAHSTEIAHLNPALNAIVTLAGEQARAAAEQAVMLCDPIGPLHGLPLAIKDITETAGIRKHLCLAALPRPCADADAEVVARLKRA